MPLSVTLKMLYPRLPRTIREDYAWCVENGIFEYTSVGLQSYVAGWVDMKHRIRTRRPGVGAPDNATPAGARIKPRY